MDDYKRVIGDSNDPWMNKPNMIAIDRANNQPTVGFIWLRLHPLSEYESEMMMNSYINILYDDGAILLARPRDK